MILNYEMVNNSNFTCIEKVIASVAQSNNRRYEMIFSEVWDFNFVLKNKNIRENIGNSIFVKKGEYFSILEKYHGIQTISKKYDNCDDIFEFINTELKSRCPIGLRFDCFYALWLPDKYKTESRRYRGYVLITGLDDYKQIHFIDVHGSKRKEILDLEEFKKGCILPEGNICNSFKIIKDEEYDIDCKDLLVNIIKRVKSIDDMKHNIFDKMEFCAEYISKNINFEQEKFSENPEMLWEIAFRFKDICRSRILFAEFLKYLYYLGKHNYLLELIELFEQSSSMWMIIYAVLARDFKKGNSDSALKDNVTDKIIKVAKFERNIAEKIEYVIC